MTTKDDTVHVVEIERFGKFLTAAISDGQLSDDEAQQLRLLASRAGALLPDLIAKHFMDTVCLSIKNAVGEMVKDGDLDMHNWGVLRRTAETLGLSVSQLREAVADPVRDMLKRYAHFIRCNSRNTPNNTRLFRELAAELTGDASYGDAEILRSGGVGAQAKQANKPVIKSEDVRWCRAFFGGMRAYYPCPGCGTELISAPTALSAEEFCPDCGTRFDFDESVAWARTKAVIRMRDTEYMTSLLGIASIAFSCPRCASRLHCHENEISGYRACPQCSLALECDDELKTSWDKKRAEQTAAQRANEKEREDYVKRLREERVREQQREKQAIAEAERKCIDWLEDMERSQEAWLRIVNYYTVVKWVCYAGMVLCGVIALIGFVLAVGGDKEDLAVASQWWDGVFTFLFIGFSAYVSYWLTYIAFSAHRMLFRIKEELEKLRETVRYRM